MPTILFVDNDGPSLMLFKAISEQLDFTTITVQRPTVLETLLPTFPTIDLVLVDLQMPEMNGYEVLKFLRPEPPFRSATFVACTVYADELENVQAAGFSGFITKPIDFDRFGAQLTALLRGETIWER